ncbi:MAG: hypothetical protein ACFCVK_20945 [Acidimicrobiales bacterium]
MTTSRILSAVSGPSTDDAATRSRLASRRRARHNATLTRPYRLPGPFAGWTMLDLVSSAVAVCCALFVFVQLRPDLLLADTTPSGGDMGAHVWGPAFLRDHLLGQGRLTGWTPDWYAGFPAYHFYMVVPSLVIVAVNAGLPPLIGIPLGLVLVATTVHLTKASSHRGRYRLAAVIVAVLALSVPYGISFKLISVAGMVAMPVAAWLMGRLARAPEPVPAFLSIGALFFLFDTNFTIYGGNIASTLAGEFAFSISLTLTLLAIGMVIRGMDTGGWRMPSAIVISLIALTHIIPLFFAIAALVVTVVLGSSVPRLWALATAAALALVPVAFADNSSTTVAALAVLAAVVVLGAAMAAEADIRKRARWLLVTGPTAALLSCFWLAPFYLREPYFNDMGWERLEDIGPPMLTVPMKVALPLAAVGIVAALAMRERIGILFAATGLISAAAVANLGEGPLWNARLLPFYYLSIYVVAVVGAALVVRFVAVAVAENFTHPDHRVTLGASALGLLAALVMVGLPLRVLPFGSDRDDGTWRWAAFTSQARSFVPSWTAWNYSGYERKPAYREYHDVVMTMSEVGRTEGCGRAMWEYSKELDRYGTPMALMLLPHWTDGCIGSMEGLYFESSSTTPFHFLNQSMLSDSPSRAQRDLPYQSFDINRGIGQLQTMGVRYYMAQSDSAIEAARFHPDLREVAVSQPFVVFEVEGSGLVEPLAVEPVVVTGRDPDSYGPEANRFDIGWLGQAVIHFNDPARYAALPAEDGPEGWDRVESLLATDGEAVPVATASGVVVDTSSIEFDVDQVGTPVLVKTSYFPNWEVEGADGPWRAGPNLMVVVPTETSVRLHYGRTPVDWLGIVLTVAGLGALVALHGLDRGRLRRSPAAEVWGEDDVDWGDDLATLPGEEDGGIGWHRTRPLRPEAVPRVSDELARPGPPSHRQNSEHQNSEHQDSERQAGELRPLAVDHEAGPSSPGGNGSGVAADPPDGGHEPDGEPSPDGLLGEDAGPETVELRPRPPGP